MEIHQGDCFNKSKYYSKGLIRIVLKFYFTITQPNLFPISLNTNNPINKNKNKKKKKEIIFEKGEEKSISEASK